MEINEIYNMDCMDGMRQMIADGQTATLTLTDIPYDSVNQTQTNFKFGKSLRKIGKGNADTLTFDLLEFLELVDNITTHGIVVFCGWGQFSTIVEFYKAKGYSVRPMVWVKSNPSPMNGENVYLSSCELAVYVKKQTGRFNAFCKAPIFKYPCGINDIHPTMKPLPLFQEIIKDLSNEHDLVFDPCIGSGTTAVACRRLNRNFIGFEIDKGYYDLCKKRVNAEMNQMCFYDLAGAL